MKTFPEGAEKRITYCPKAIEANLPRVRRHEPVFLVEVEEGDTFVTHRALSVDIKGYARTSYIPATGFVRIKTTAEVVLDATDDEAQAEATTPAPKKKARK